MSSNKKYEEQFSPEAGLAFGNGMDKIFSEGNAEKYQNIARARNALKEILTKSIPWIKERDESILNQIAELYGKETENWIKIKTDAGVLYTECSVENTIIQMGCPWIFENNLEHLAEKGAPIESLPEKDLCTRKLKFEVDAVERKRIFLDAQYNPKMGYGLFFADEKERRCYIFSAPAIALKKIENV